MIDQLKDWWHVIAGFIASGVWLIRLSGRVKAIEDDDSKYPCMTKDMCDERRTGCQTGNSLQFAAGVREFDEIKKQMAANHQELMALLLSIRKE